MACHWVHVAVWARYPEIWRVIVSLSRAGDNMACHWVHVTVWACYREIWRMIVSISRAGDNMACHWVHITVWARYPEIWEKGRYGLRSTLSAAARSGSAG